MARRLPGGAEFGYRTTDHSEEVALLRSAGVEFAPNYVEALVWAVGADLLEAHDETGISLDNWMSARLLVEHLLDGPILDNGI